MEERSKVHIIVSELQRATEVGTCNACTEQTTADGTDPHALVYEVQLRSLAFRLCKQCARDLRWCLGDRFA